MKSNKKRLLSIVLLAAALFLLSSCDEKEKGMLPSGPVAAEVRVMTVMEESLHLSIELPGRTTAFRVAEVRPQVSGIVTRRLFTEGSEVAAGELLYQIDPAIYAAVLASAEAALAKSEAMEYSARLKAGRYRALVKTEAVSEQEQVDAEAAWKQALAEVAAAKAAVQSARINLDYTKVTAPIAGRIGRSMISEGALVTAQQPTALATIQQLDPLFIDVNQSAHEFLALKKRLAQSSGNSKGSVTEVKVILDDSTEYGGTGVLEFSDVAVDQSTGTVTIRAVIANPRQELLPGMFVRARLTAPEPQNVILVPQAAIIRNTRGQSMLMLVDDASRVEARIVETGRNRGNHTVITKGLVAGEQIIVSGLQKIRPGAEVKAVELQPETERQAVDVEQNSAAKVN
ncbi:MAG: efflux RND transporter periplasmic adaptor subunit [Desulfopila sp.]|jgi:membrane fusion protein (multidrug efflux system)|nr:efflux RND transporter periplasmic adaptor subunit [Desulfopila sp.]